MATEAPPRAGRRQWIGLAVLVLPAALVTMDMTVLLLAIPKLSQDLQPSGTQLLWITDIYGFILAGSLITMGTLGDRIGRRRLLLTGAAVFGVVSLLAAFSVSAGMLIGARALLGLAGATVAPCTLSPIHNMFPDPGQRTRAIAVWFTANLAGGAIGPLAGGALLQYFWWGSVFLMGPPVMLLLVATGPVLLPEYRPRQAGRLDLFSVVLSLAAALSVVYGLKQFAAHGLGWPPALVIAAGLAVGVVFVRRQRALADPLLDLTLFRSRTVCVSLGTLTLVILFMLGSGYLTAQYLQLVLGLSPLQAGMWNLPPLVGGILVGMLAPRIVRRARPSLVMGGGLLVAVAGFGVLTQVAGGHGLVFLVAGTALLFVGATPVATLCANIVVAAAPHERSGAASAMAQTSQEFGGAVGLAVLGSIVTAAYRTQITGAIPPGVSTEAARAARDTLGGAAAVATQLPDQLGAALLATARAAFTHGLQLTALISAVILASYAVLVTVLLRHVPTESATQDQPTESSPDPT